MRSEVYSVALSGLAATLVKITVTLEPGTPSLKFTGIDEWEVRYVGKIWANALGRSRRYPMQFDASGTPVRPGEVSLAHHGVLLVDDLQSWRADRLAALDAVLADGQAEPEAGICYPARPLLLVLDALPCRCGYHQRVDQQCTCTPADLRKYRSQLGGPVVDRAELRVCFTGRAPRAPAERSAEIRARVLRARDAQGHRFERSEVSAPVNGRLTVADLERVAAPDEKGRRALDRAGLAPELRAKVLRVARTIADLDGSDAVHARHLDDAIQWAPRPET